MSRLPLRLRIAFMTGLIVFIVSMISMFVSTYYANSAISEAVLVTNNYYFENVIDETYLAADNVTEEATEAEEAAGTEEDTINMIDLEPAAKVKDSANYFNDDYIQYIRDNFQMMELLISLGASIIGMILTYYFSSKMLEPLHELATRMMNVTHNNLNQKIIEAESDDEIGNLTYSFNKMTERLDEQFARQKDFSANVAHELRTPLSIMKMSYQVIDDGTTLPEFQHAKQMNEKQVDNLIKICDDLMSFANDEEIKITEVVNIDNIFNLVLENLKVLIEAKEINVVRDIDDTIAVLGNRRLIYQLLSNLVNNAIKYNNQGGTVYLMVNRENQEITITVADNGIGMDKESLKHIFEPFYRENKSRSRKTGGTGLGLAIVKQIVDQHGWRIDVESTKNKKSMFIITI